MTSGSLFPRVGPLRMRSMRPSLAVLCVVAACTRGPRTLHPGGGDHFDLISPGPAGPPPPDLSGGGTTDERFARFETWWSGRLDAHGATGGVVVLAPDGSVHLGIHGPRGATVTSDTRFGIASSSKVVLAMTVMSLVEEHRLALDAPISTYLPELVSPATDVGDVSLAQLLSHTSGIPPEGQESGIACAVGDDLGAHVRALRGRALEFPPGAVYHYANLGYVVVGAVIERVTGMPFEQVVRARILGPAGMTTAGYGAAPGDATGLPSGVGPAPPCRAIYPAGGLWVSTREMGALLRALLPGAGVISDASLAELQRPRTPTGAGLEDAYGLGLGMTRYRSASLFTHMGGMPGFSSAWVTLPDHGFAAAVLVNTQSTPVTLALRAADALVDFTEPATTPAPRPKTEWPRYVGRYRTDTGPLGTFDIVLDDGSLGVEWVGPEPAIGLPASMTMFFVGEANAQYVETPIGVARRVP